MKKKNVIKNTLTRKSPTNQAPTWWISHARFPPEKFPSMFFNSSTNVFLDFLFFHYYHRYHWCYHGDISVNQRNWFTLPQYNKNIFFKENHWLVVFLPKRTCAHLEPQETPSYHTFSTVKGTFPSALPV